MALQIIKKLLKMNYRKTFEMKISKILFGAAWTIIIAVSFNACKKNTDKKPVCRIFAFTVAGQAYHISYNNQGKIISLTGGSLSDSYDYFGDTTIVTSLVKTMVPVLIGLMMYLNIMKMNLLNKESKSNYKMVAELSVIFPQKKNSLIN